ncbi:hypothetical protein HYW44_00440 [Candidatus Daviesbacteria bacterium]|nr:hypothetical protein [Candidatus Daviesbacteria bacterium]
MSDKGAEQIKPQAIPKGEYIADLKRRKLIKTAAAVVAAATGGGAALLNSTNKAKPEPKRVTPEPTRAANEKQTFREISNQILSLKPTSPERVNLEKNLAGEVATPEQIDKSLWVISDINIRLDLLNKRYNLRLNGREGLKPLSPEKEAWANSKGIHAEALALCEESYREAVRIMEILRGKGIFKTDPPAQRRIMNPGELAEVLVIESSAGTNTGQTKLVDFFKTFPIETTALSELAAHTSLITGLDYSSDRVLGSSTGDMGPFQFRPSTAMEAVSDAAKAGVMLNIFDISEAGIAALIYLASKGYDIDRPEKRKEAVTGWNRDIGKNAKLYESGDDYRQKFSK